LLQNNARVLKNKAGLLKNKRHLLAHLQNSSCPESISMGVWDLNKNKKEPPCQYASAFSPL
jgi:hypothetical protein